MNKTAEVCSLHRTSFKVLTTMAYALCFIVSLAGNLMVICVVHRNKSLRNSTNFFIVNMAVSDLIVPLLIIPRVLKEIITSSQAWEVGGVFGEALCKTTFFLSDIAPVVSIFSLIFISLDRFHAVVLPMRKPLFTTRVRAVLIAFTWFMSCCVCTPYFYAFKLLPINGVMYCNIYWGPHLDNTKTHEAYTTFLCITIIIVPFVILTAIYASICVVLTKRKVIGENIPRLITLQADKARKVVKLAVTVVAICAVCWGPYATLLLLLSFKWNWEVPTGCSWEIMWSTIQFLALSNAAVNPTVYFIFIQSYRQGLKRVLTSLRSSAWRRLSRTGSSGNTSKQLRKRTAFYELDVTALKSTQKITTAL